MRHIAIRKLKDTHEALDRSVAAVRAAREWGIQEGGRA